MSISYRKPKKDKVEIYPKFMIKDSQDLMIRGGDFYAIWVENRHLWSTNENDAVELIDFEIEKAEIEYRQAHPEEDVKTFYMRDGDSGMIDKWHRYCQRQKRDSYHMLDEEIIFGDSETTKEDYASKKLSYPLQPCDIHAYES